MGFGEPSSQNLASSTPLAALASSHVRSVFSLFSASSSSLSSLLLPPPKRNFSLAPSRSTLATSFCATRPHRCGLSTSGPPSSIDCWGCCPLPRRTAGEWTRVLISLICGTWLLVLWDLVMILEVVGLG